MIFDVRMRIPHKRLVLGIENNTKSAKNFTFNPKMQQKDVMPFEIGKLKPVSGRTDSCATSKVF